MARPIRLEFSGAVYGSLGCLRLILFATQARVSDIKRGSIQSFSLDLLVRLAAGAELRPSLSLAT